MQNKHQWTHGRTFWLQNKASRANSEQESRLQHVGTCYQREPTFWHQCTVQCWNEKCLLPPLKWVLCIVGEVLSHAMTLAPLRRMCDLILSHQFWPLLSVNMQWSTIWEVWLGVWTNLMPWLLFPMILWFSGSLMVKQHEDVHMSCCQTLQPPSSTQTWYTQTGNTLCRPHDAYQIFILCCKCCIVGKYARELALLPELLIVN